MSLKWVRGDRSMSELDPKDLIGEKYTPELGKRMPYGGLVSFKGVITRVMTKSDYENSH